jgi:hypothetical protein
MDRSQLYAFVNYAIGDRDIGTADGETITTPHSPELRAFVVARLGDAMPPYASAIVPYRGGLQMGPKFAEQAKAFADLLREVADGIDPVAAPKGAA